MKKVLLTAMAILTVASASAFGMYGANSDWIDFLTDGNMLKARMDTLGFTLGNGTIKGTFGFKNAGGLIISKDSVTTTDGTKEETKVFYNFQPTLSAGIGYTTEAFGIGLGYNYQYLHGKISQGKQIGTAVIPSQNPGESPTYAPVYEEPSYDRVASMRYWTKNGVGLSVHTPVLTFNAMNNRLKIVVPIQVAVKNADVDTYKDQKYLGLSMDPQIRFYPGLDFLTEFRLTVKYGMNQYTYRNAKDEIEKNAVSSFGFDFRTYFAAQVGDIALSPYIKVTYDTALDKQAGDYAITAGSAYTVRKLAEGATATYDSNPWKLVVLPTLGLSANADVVSLYGEVGLGYMAINDGSKPHAITDAEPWENKPISHYLAWKAYGEVKVTPIKDLEWYMEMEIGNDVSAGSNPNTGAFNFATGTGLTWYLPSLNGAE